MRPKPYDWERKDSELVGPPKYDHLLPPPVSDNQFLSELKREVAIRDSRRARAADRMVALAESAIAVHNAPVNPGGAEHVSVQWMDSTPVHIDVATTMEIVDAGRNLPDISQELPKPPGSQAA